jgi:two-component system NarL family sensor kinase
LAIALSGLALNVSEQRVADAKLKALTQRVVRSQEDERARLSRDLHDGISQWLVSIKLQIESGIARLVAGGAQADQTRSFDRAAVQLNDVLGEVRRISHNLRPALLDDLGLAAALDHLLREFAGLTGLDAKFEAQGKTDGLTDVENTVLFRIAQETLTNIERHANATRVKVRLRGSRSRVQLLISDDGRGFDVEHVSSHPKTGIGLRNMYERMEAVRGALQLVSSPIAGTQVIATLQKT